MSDTRAVRHDLGFVQGHPALIAALVGLSITGIFLYALYLQLQGHEGGHGAEHGAQTSGAPGAAPAGSGAAPAAPAH